MRQLYTTKENSLWVLILCLFLTTQTACMNDAHRLRADGDDGYMADDESECVETYFSEAINTYNTYKKYSSGNSAKIAQRIIKQTLNIGNKQATALLINSIFRTLSRDDCDQSTKLLLRDMLIYMYQEGLIVFENILKMEVDEDIKYELLSLAYVMEQSVTSEKILEVIHMSGELSEDAKKSMLERIFKSETHAKRISSLKTNSEIFRTIACKYFNKNNMPALLRAKLK